MFHDRTLTGVAGWGSQDDVEEGSPVFSCLRDLQLIDPAGELSRVDCLTLSGRKAFSTPCTCTRQPHGVAAAFARQEQSRRKTTPSELCLLFFSLESARIPMMLVAQE